jgi:hypothetical protein
MTTEQTIELFRQHIAPTGKFGVLYIPGKLGVYHPRLVLVHQPDDDYDVDGDLEEIITSDEELGNAAGIASVKVRRIARALGILDAEESEELAGIA